MATQSNNNQRVYYTYAHYTADTNILFYIGVGTILNTKTFKERTRYSRAYHTNGRNKYWKNVVNKHGFKVEILNLFETKEESLLEERNLISKYGKRINQGMLVNMSDGGEIGPIGRPNPMSEEQKRKLSEIKSLTLYVYNATTGSFIKEVKTIKKTAEFCGVTYNAVHSCMKTKNYTNGFFVFKDFKGTKLSYTSKNLNFSSTLSKAVEARKGQEILSFKSIADCAKFLNRERSSVRQSIKKGSKCNGYYIRTISSQDPK